MSEDAGLVLHVWPSRWNLPTFTPACLAAILYLQLTMPGNFLVEECTNPDVSPDGQLPYLTHGLACITSFPSIVKHVDSLRRSHISKGEEEVDGEVNMTPSGMRVKEAQTTVWISFVSAHLSDLVACSFFTLRHNYYDFLRTALAELFPVPQRYYVPDRLRETYKPRLEAAGLWTISAEEAEEEKRRQKGVAGTGSVQEAFGKAKVLDKARRILDVLSRLIDDKPFFLNSPEPTALDTLVAAHILLLTIPPFPNDLLRSLINESYPSLLAHSRRIQGCTLPSVESLALTASLSSSFEVVESQARPVEEVPPLKTRPQKQPSFTQVISSLAVPLSFRNVFSFRKGTKSKADKEFDRMRWGWYGLVALGIVGWIWSTGFSIRFVTAEELENAEGLHDIHPVEEPEDEIEEDEYE